MQPEFGLVLLSGELRNPEFRSTDDSSISMESEIELKFRASECRYLSPRRFVVGLQNLAVPLSLKMKRLACDHLAGSNLHIEPTELIGFSRRY